MAGVFSDNKTDAALGKIQMSKFVQFVKFWLTNL